MKRWTASLVCVAVAAVATAHAQELVGEWDMKMDYQGNMIDSKMIVTKGDGGALGGVWTSARGESELQNLTIDGNNVTFTRTVEVQGQSFDIAFDGKIDGDSITGAFETAMGTLDVTGARAGGGGGDLTPLVGDWNAHVSSGLGEFDHVITLSDDGTGEYNGEGATYDITDVALAGDAVTFAMAIDLDGQELAMKFEGKLDGSALNGEFITDFGNGTVTATKAGAAAGGIAALVGNWDAHVSSGLGDFDHQMTFKDDGTGVYTGDGVTYPLTEVAVSGGAVTFGMVLDLDGQELPLTFEGTLDGDALDGEFISDMGNGTVAAKRAGGGGGDLGGLVTELLGHLKGQDIETLMTYYADDFESDQGGGKAEFGEFLMGAKDQGFLEDMEAVTDDMEIEVDGDKASIENIELEGAFGVLTIGFELEKRDGKWIVTYQSQY